MLGSGGQATLRMRPHGLLRGSLQLIFVKVCGGHSTLAATGLLMRPRPLSLQHIVLRPLPRRRILGRTRQGTRSFRMSTAG